MHLMKKILCLLTIFGFIIGVCQQSSTLEYSSRNHKATLGKEDFAKYKYPNNKYTRIKMDNCSITEIQRNAFENFVRLKYLIITNSIIGKILLFIPTLRSLNLFNTNLKEPLDLENFPDMEFLALESNNMTEIAFKMKKSKLIHLKVLFNHLRYVNLEFDSLKTLVFIDSTNSSTKFNLKCPNLDTIEFDHDISKSQRRDLCINNSTKIYVTFGITEKNYTCDVIFQEKNQTAPKNEEKIAKKSQTEKNEENIDENKNKTEKNKGNIDVNKSQSDENKENTNVSTNQTDEHDDKNVTKTQTGETSYVILGIFVVFFIIIIIIIIIVIIIGCFMLYKFLKKNKEVENVTSSILFVNETLLDEALG